MDDDQEYKEASSIPETSDPSKVNNPEPTTETSGAHVEKKLSNTDVISNPSQENEYDGNLEDRADSKIGSNTLSNAILNGQEDTERPRHVRLEDNQKSRDTFQLLSNYETMSDNNDTGANDATKPVKDNEAANTVSQISSQHEGTENPEIQKQTGSSQQINKDVPSMPSRRSPSVISQREQPNVGSGPPTRVQSSPLNEENGEDEQQKKSLFNTAPSAPTNQYHDSSKQEISHRPVNEPSKESVFAQEEPDRYMQSSEIIAENEVNRIARRSVTLSKPPLQRQSKDSSDKIPTEGSIRSTSEIKPDKLGRESVSRQVADERPIKHIREASSVQSSDLQHERIRKESSLRQADEASSERPRKESSLQRTPSMVKPIGDRSSGRLHDSASERQVRESSSKQIQPTTPVKPTRDGSSQVFSDTVTTRTGRESVARQSQTSRPMRDRSVQTLPETTTSRLSRESSTRQMPSQSKSPRDRSSQDIIRTTSRTSRGTQFPPATPGEPWEPISRREPSSQQIPFSASVKKSHDNQQLQTSRSVKDQGTQRSSATEDHARASKETSKVPRERPKSLAEEIFIREREIARLRRETYKLEMERRRSEAEARSAKREKEGTENLKKAERRSRETVLTTDENTKPHKKGKDPKDSKDPELQRRRGSKDRSDTALKSDAQSTRKGESRSKDTLVSTKTSGDRASQSRSWLFKSRESVASRKDAQAPVEKRKSRLSLRSKHRQSSAQLARAAPAFSSGGRNESVVGKVPPSVVPQKKPETGKPTAATQGRTQSVPVTPAAERRQSVSAPQSAGKTAQGAPASRQSASAQPGYDRRSTSQSPAPQEKKQSVSTQASAGKKQNAPAQAPPARRQSVSMQAPPARRQSVSAPPERRPSAATTPRQDRRQSVSTQPPTNRNVAAYSAATPNTSRLPTEAAERNISRSKAAAKK